MAFLTEACHISQAFLYTRCLVRLKTKVSQSNLIVFLHSDYPFQGLYRYIAYMFQIGFNRNPNRYCHIIYNERADSAQCGWEQGEQITKVIELQSHIEGIYVAQKLQIQSRHSKNFNELQHRVRLKPHIRNQNQDQVLVSVLESKLFLRIKPKLPPFFPFSFT